MPHPAFCSQNASSGTTAPGNAIYRRSLVSGTKGFRGQGAVDVQQADATRCTSSTGFTWVNALCESRTLSLSAHSVPSIHAHPICALPQALNGENFCDHARIEHMLFDGMLTPVNGALYPDLSHPVLGLEFERTDAARNAV
ncbi:MAG TPA: enolase C-terminal domain-like protein [Nitrolancea sp.]|nr:enolase C-terminal domain-like protein [Nitrolancea sp.]